MSYQAGSAGPEQRAELFAERREREGRPRVRGVVAILAALLVMGFFAGGLWLAYHEGLRHATGGAAGSGEVPLIRADERPTKVKPEKMKDAHGRWDLHAAMSGRHPAGFSFMPFQQIAN